MAACRAVSAAVWRVATLYFTGVGEYIPFMSTPAAATSWYRRERHRASLLLLDNQVETEPRSFSWRRRFNAPGRQTISAFSSASRHRCYSLAPIGRLAWRMVAVARAVGGSNLGVKLGIRWRARNSGDDVR